jgi:SAM-dependent methyltransferase
MNLGHAPLTAWGLGHVQIDPRFRILDIGCGGGRTLRTLAEMASNGHVDGVDYAPASVATSRESSADLLQAGRVSVQQASVSQLPFRSASFDLITAVETHYYWPDLHRDLLEVLRVLKPGGQFVLIAETYNGRARSWLYAPVMRLLRARYLTLEQHRAALADAGFAGVEVHAHPWAGWMCAVGTRPNSAHSA